MKFIGRRRELEALEREDSKKSASFVVIYGRRRIGKTRLIGEFLRGKKNAAYYLAADQEDYLQIKEFKVSLNSVLKDDYLANADFKDWSSFFLYLDKIWPKQTKIILAIDEITYIIKNNKSFTSYLQRFWDMCISKSNTTLLISGSSVSLMLNTVLSGTSPLYGRRTAEIFLQEFDVYEAKEFLGKNMTESIRIYSIIGGIPKYLELAINGYDDLIRQIFDKRSFFFREGIYLMTEEFNDISTYSNILKAISEGKNSLNDITQYCNMDSKKISAYIRILADLSFVREDVPISKKREKFRGKIYSIKDTFMDFWFKIINSNRSLIEMDMTEKLMETKKNDINSFIGRKFEKVCMQYLAKKSNYEFTHIGKEWGTAQNKKTYEIDIMAINKKNEVLFAECKWQDNIDAENILSILKEKTMLVQWKNDVRKEHYFIFAKSFRKKIISGAELIDLKLIEMLK